MQYHAVRRTTILIRPFPDAPPLRKLLSNRNASSVKCAMEVAAVPKKLFGMTLKGLHPHWALLNTPLYRYAQLRYRY